ncbi:hypothetical protein D5S17_26960 [Pseudonocardiaceae bacterium YIM PH 21723]|nr:hypothetical protein D5S17_26960 [Pseudonocardiaceae bacterium YIM PH 21723]
MRTRGLLLVAMFAALTSCAAPEPPLSSGTAPTLEADLVAYDNLDFQTTRKAVYDSSKKCAGLPASYLRELNYTPDPRREYGDGCTMPTSWGFIGFTQSAPSYRQSKQVTFQDFWNKGTYGTGYFQRSILLDRYYAVTTVDSSEQGACIIRIDTGNIEPFVVRATPPREQAEANAKADRDFPVDEVLANYCTRGKEAAEKLLPLLDSGGGSRRAP